MEPFLGQITLFACNFAPYNWMTCTGQLLPISQYSALFSLLGTYYGGDGRTTFALPDLRGRVPVGMGQGPGLSYYQIGEIGGAEDVSLTQQTVPSHTHQLLAYTAAATTMKPNGALPAAGPVVPGRHTQTMNLYLAGAPNVGLAAAQVQPVAGSGVPHTNLQPLLTLNWCIATAGIFPARS